MPVKLVKSTGMGPVSLFFDKSNNRSKPNCNIWWGMMPSKMFDESRRNFSIGSLMLSQEGILPEK
jgi:hypothetical protein